jgi:hypothetical protein
MNQNKTQPTGESVDKFISSIADAKRKADSQKLLKIMLETAGFKPYMYGSSIVAFGTHTYKYASGREGEWLIVGFSPRKTAMVLYGIIYYDRGLDLAKKLGPHTEGKGCLYIKDLDKIDIDVLKQMIQKAVKEKDSKYS